MPLTHVAKAHMPTRAGSFAIHAFRDGAGQEHVAVVAGQPLDGCLLRLHSECLTGDIFGSLRCDCRAQLETAMQMIAAAGSGLVIYMRGHEGRGIGIGNKIRAYRLQELGLDTAEANLHLGLPVDARNYTAAAQILDHFGIHRVRLMTNNTDKIDCLTCAGIQVMERIPLWTAINPHNAAYLHTKRAHMGHLGAEDVPEAPPPIRFGNESI